MNKNICEICSTENEADYRYCKNCGAPISVKEEISTPESTEAHSQAELIGNNPKQTNPQLGFFTVNDYNGVSAEEMTAFIGKKANVILPKFTKMEIANSKVSWCWPAAVLGYILGPMGSAIWFFYRKMYRPAIIFAVIGAVITLITSVMTFGTANELYDGILDAFASGNIENAVEILESMEPEKTALTIGAEFITELSNIASAVVAGIFGFYFYKKHCVNKITSYRSYQADQRYYKIGLASIGGVSGGMLAVGILAIVIVNNMVSFITTLVSLIA